MEQCFRLWASESVRVCDLAHSGGGRVVTPKWGQSGLLLSRDLPFRCAGLFLRQLAEGNGFNDSAAHSASARALKWPFGDDYEVLENGQAVGCIFRCPSRRKTVPGGGRAATTAKSDALRMEADARSRDGCVREKLAMRELGEGAGRGYSFRRRWRGAVSCTPCNG